MAEGEAPESETDALAGLLGLGPEAAARGFPEARPRTPAVAVQVPALSAPLSFFATRCCYDYWAARPGEAKALNPSWPYWLNAAQVMHWVDVTAHFHLQSDLQLPEDERNYDTPAALISGLADQIKSELDAEAERRAAETRRGTVAAVRRAIGDIASKEVLARIDTLWEEGEHAT